MDKNLLKGYTGLIRPDLQAGAETDAWLTLPMVPESSAAGLTAPGE
jgi:hypothetical protein